MRIVVTGSICNLDICFGELLAKAGHQVLVVRSKHEPELEFNTLPTYPIYLTKENIITVSTPFEFYRLQSDTDFLVSISGGVINKFGKLWPLSPLLIRVPHISIASGSDLSELIIQKNLLSAVYRRILKTSKRILTPPYPQIIKNLTELHLLANTRFLRFPMLLPDSTKTVNLNGPVRILHATNLDWGVTDNGVWRNSTKGNDRFLKGIFTALQYGADLHCDIAFRGPDKHVAKKWIDESGHSERFSWFDEVNQSQLQDMIITADIVVDQFEVGGFGLIALEAMNAGTAVLIYLDQEYLSAQYGEISVPVVNLRDPDEISNYFLNSNKMDLHRLGIRAKEWVKNNHGINSESFGTLLELLTREK